MSTQDEDELKQVDKWMKSIGAEHYPSDGPTRWYIPDALKLADGSPCIYHIQEDAGLFWYKQFQSIKEQAEREVRIASIQLYMDTCERNGVPPSWRNLREFQDGQRAAYKNLHSTNKSLEEKK